MDLTLLVVILLVGVALTFDYINGFHDAANSIATVVATRVLTPGQAVVWAAIFNFLAAFTFGTAVASTVGRGMIDISVVTQSVIFSGLMGAIIWDLIAWYVALPTSSSHALVGGYAGAAIAKAGFGSLIMSGWTKTLIFSMVLAPLIGFSLALLLSIITLWMFRGFSPHRVDTWFRRLQASSAAAYGSATVQRCAEDDGHHHRRALQRLAICVAFSTSPGRVVMAAQRQWRWAL